MHAEVGGGGWSRRRALQRRRRWLARLRPRPPEQRVAPKAKTISRPRSIVVAANEERTPPPTAARLHGCTAARLTVAAVPRGPAPVPAPAPALRPPSLLRSLGAGFRAASAGQCEEDVSHHPWRPCERVKGRRRRRRRDDLSRPRPRATVTQTEPRPRIMRDMARERKKKCPRPTGCPGRAGFHVSPFRGGQTPRTWRRAAPGRAWAWGRLQTAGGRARLAAAVGHGQPGALAARWTVAPGWAPGASHGLRALAVRCVRCIRSQIHPARHGAGDAKAPVAVVSSGLRS